MSLLEHPFTSLSQFIELAMRYSSTGGWIFRGQTNIEWALRPKAGRPEYFVKATPYWKAEDQPSSDLGRFNEWRRHAIAFSPSVPESEFNCLAYAQHYGLATRLLDWTENPLVALYFSVEEDLLDDGGVFCHFPSYFVQSEMSSPRTCKALVGFRPPPFDRRIVAQSGLFTFHPDPREAMIPGVPHPKIPKLAVIEGTNLVVLRVKKEMKGILQRQLAELGISRKTLFPDLDGLSRFVNWRTARIASRHSKVIHEDEQTPTDLAASNELNAEF